VLSRAALAPGPADALEGEAKRFAVPAILGRPPIVVPVLLEDLPRDQIMPSLRGYTPVTGPYGKAGLHRALIDETLRRLGLLPRKNNWLLFLLAALIPLLLACVICGTVGPGAGWLRATFPALGGNPASRQVSTPPVPTVTVTPGTGLRGDYYMSVLIPDTGTPVPTPLATPAATPGPNDVYGKFLFTKVDPNIDIDTHAPSPYPGATLPDARLARNGASWMPFAVRWTGKIRPRYSEQYTFTTHSDDGVKLWVNGQLLVDNWSIHADSPNSGTITLTAGQFYDIVVEYYENGEDGATMVLEWQSASQAREVVPQGQLYQPAG